LIEKDKVSFGHARALLGVQDPMMQRRLAQKIVKHNWSVRETERRVKYLHRDEAASPRTAIEKNLDPNLRAAETKLRRALGTQVRIVPGRAGTPGQLEIEYYDMNDLDRIFNIIVRNADVDHTHRAAAR
jgi:ParB family chromosome partitioning protein